MLFDLTDKLKKRELLFVLFDILRSSTTYTNQINYAKAHAVSVSVIWLLLDSYLHFKSVEVSKCQVLLITLIIYVVAPPFRCAVYAIG